jgi:hypothetical protein
LLQLGPISGSHRGLDLTPSTMGQESDHGTSKLRAGPAGLAGRDGVCRRADRNSPSGGGMPGQAGSAITPLADRLGPLIVPPLEPVSVRFPGVSSGEHGHDRGDPQFGRLIHVRGVIGREPARSLSRDELCPKCALPHTPRSTPELFWPARGGWTADPTNVHSALMEA